MHAPLSILSCAISLAAFLDVLVVQPGGPPGTFQDIQSACNQAQERDTVLVKSGNYPSFAVGNKWLTIASDVGVPAIVNGGINVSGLQAGKRVTVIGFVSRSLNSTIPALRLTADLGSVRITNCQFTGANAAQFEHAGGDGVVVTGCSDVSFSNCTGIGGLAQFGYAGPPGGAGMRVTQSSAALYDCTLLGGNGQNGEAQLSSDGGDGGDGCHSVSSDLFASHTTFHGGHGGDAAQAGFSFTLPGSGGNGLSQSGGTARLVSPLASGGTPGSGPMGYPGHATTGGTIITLPVTFRSMSVVPDPIREGTSLNVVVNGMSGDKVALAVTPVTSSMFNAAWNGQQLFPAGTTLLRFGTISPGGSLAHFVPFADLGPGVAARTYQLQALFAGTDGNRVLGTPISVLVLDSAY